LKQAGINTFAVLEYNIIELHFIFLINICLLIDNIYFELTRFPDEFCDASDVEESWGKVSNDVELFLRQVQTFFK